MGYTGIHVWDLAPIALVLLIHGATATGLDHSSLSLPTATGRDHLGFSPPTATSTDHFGLSRPTATGTDHFGLSPPIATDLDHSGLSPPTVTGLDHSDLSPPTVTGLYHFGLSPPIATGMDQLGFSPPTVTSSPQPGLTYPAPAGSCEGSVTPDPAGLLYMFNSYLTTGINLSDASLEEGAASSVPASPVEEGKRKRTLRFSLLTALNTKGVPPTPTVISRSRLDLSIFPCTLISRYL
ncbi:hypothetical protein J6590_059548, partial [Homalodisca vitripennis]